MQQSYAHNTMIHQNSKLKYKTRKNHSQSKFNENHLKNEIYINPGVKQHLSKTINNASRKILNSLKDVRTLLAEELLIPSPLLERLATLDLHKDSITFDPVALYNIDPNVSDNINGAMRDFSVRKLFILHKAFFFDLSPETFVHSLTIIDEFVTRIRVKPKYMDCVATAAYYLASQIIEPLELRPSLETLVTLSRCGGTTQDLYRMSCIIQSKLECRPTDQSNNALAYLDVFREILGVSMASITQPSSLGQLSCLRAVDYVIQSLTCFSLRSFSPACLALSAIYLDNRLYSSVFTTGENRIALMWQQLLVGHMAQLCNVSLDDMLRCATMIEAVLIHGSTQQQQQQQQQRDICIRNRQRLYMDLSTRTRNAITNFKSWRPTQLLNCIPETELTASGNCDDRVMMHGEVCEEPDNKTLNCIFNEHASINNFAIEEMVNTI